MTNLPFTFRDDNIDPRLPLPVSMIKFITAILLIIFVGQLSAFPLTHGELRTSRREDNASST
jgi:hypothetical protein